MVQTLFFAPVIEKGANFKLISLENEEGKGF